MAEQTTVSTSTNRQRGLSRWLASIAIVIAVVALAVGLAGRQAPRNGVGGIDATFARIKETKVVRAGYIVYPPTVTAGADASKPSGFLIEIMDEVAAGAAFSVRYEPTTFDDFNAGLQSGKYDVIVAGIFQNIPRAREMAFVRPIVYWAGVTAITKKSQAGAYQSLAMLNEANVRVAVTAGTAEHDFVKKHLPRANVQPRPDSDINLTLAEVTAGRADVAFADAVTVRKYLRGKEDLTVLFGGRQFNTFATSFVVRPTDVQWLHFLNSAIESLQIEGTVRRLSDKYKGDEVWTLPQLPFE